VRALSPPLLALLVALSSSAHGAPRRRHFEPDDLALEEPGILDLDLQLGPVSGASASGGNHVVMPDFEIGLGLTRNVELDVSGTFTLDRENGRRHIAGDALWIASKLGLFDACDGGGNAWALGLELGPRLPTLGSEGIGYGALALLGFTRRGLALVLNAGSLIDPGASLREQRPTSLALGFDLNAQLDQRQKWSLQSELGFTHYFSSDPDELAFTVGVTHAVSRRLDLSLTALSSFLHDTEHFGVLLGASPQVGLW
jgi:hypothetical protein